MNDGSSDQPGAYGVVGAQWIKSVGSAHKQAVMVAQQHLDVIAALTL